MFDNKWSVVLVSVKKADCWKIDLQLFSLSHFSSKNGKYLIVPSSQMRKFVAFLGITL